MSTIQSSTEHLTLNADGASKDIKFQANGVEVSSISSAGAFTSTSIDATKLSGALPAIDGSALTNLPDGSIGVGQTWQSVSRSGGTTYTNSTGKTIVIFVYSYRQAAIYINGTSFSYGGYSGSHITLVIPNGDTYRVSNPQGTWFELR